MHFSRYHLKIKLFHKNFHLVSFMMHIFYRCDSGLVSLVSLYPYPKVHPIHEDILVQEEIINTSIKIL